MCVCMCVFLFMADAILNTVLFFTVQVGGGGDPTFGCSCHLCFHQKLGLGGLCCEILREFVCQVQMFLFPCGQGLCDYRPPGHSPVSTWTGNLLTSLCAGLRFPVLA